MLNGTPSNTNQQTDLTVGAALALLLVASAWDVTAKGSMIIGSFLLLLAWASAYQNGTLEAFGKAAF